MSATKGRLIRLERRRHPPCEMMQGRTLEEMLAQAEAEDLWQ